MAWDQMQCAPFFGKVAVRSQDQAGAWMITELDPGDAMKLSRDLAKAAKASGYVKPPRPEKAAPKAKQAKGKKAGGDA